VSNSALKEEKKMSEKFKFSLSGMWLFVCVFTLLIPVFLPSVAGWANPSTNAVGAATASMFILSFPSSLFGLPLMFFVGDSIGVNPNSIEGMYLNLFVMFVLGLVQWFWVLPRIWRNDPKVQILDLPAKLEDRPMRVFAPAETFSAFDQRMQTPVERVLRQENESDPPC